MKNPEQAQIDANVLRLQSNMEDAVGATNILGSTETMRFLSKSSQDDGLDGVFGSNLARLGGIQALAAQAEKVFATPNHACCANWVA